MKHYEWINGNHQKIHTGLKTFDQQIGGISHGNVIDDVQYSSFIRPYTEIECNGFTSAKGHLRSFDLQYFNRLPFYFEKRLLERTMEAGGILYKFRHWRHVPDCSEPREIVDCYIFTANKPPYEVLEKVWCGPTWKSNEVMEAVIPYISDAGYPQDCKHPQEQVMTSRIFDWGDHPRIWTIFCNQCGKVLLYDALVPEDYVNPDKEK